MMQRLLSDYDRELPPMNGNIRLQASVMQLSIWPQMIGTDADRNSACHWGHPYKLYKAQCENSKRRNFFTERIVNVWNSLPANVDFSSLPRFKQSVEQVDFHSFCSVISYNHIVRFWLHYIFYYFVCVLCVFFSSLTCVRVYLIGLSCIMSWFYLLFLAYEQLSVLCSLSVQLSVNCHCLWLLIAGAK